MRRRLQLETKNYAKNSGKWDFSTISTTIFSLKKRLNCSLNTLASLVTDWNTTKYDLAIVILSSCHLVKIKMKIESKLLINIYIY